MGKKFRVQLDFSEGAFNELNRLQKELDASSRAEVLRDALAVLRWVIEEESKGYKITVRGENDRVIEPVFPFYVPSKKTVEAQNCA
jgi:metal-responsive CopG/Arc/MetJ family transcriptional regulator